MLTFHFLEQQADLIGQQGLSLPSPCPSQHFRRTQGSLGSCLPHELPGRPKEVSITHLFLQLTHFLLEEHFHVLQNHFHLLHPLFCCFQLLFMCFLKKMRAPWTARRANKSLLKQIRPEYSLQRLMPKLQYFGHLMRRTDSLEKNLMLGKAEGRRRRGQQRMRWLDGITDLMVMSLSKLRSW